MVLDKAALQSRPALKFTHTELEAILEAMRNDEDIKQATVAKVQTLVTFARTKQAYRTEAITLTAQ